MLKAPAQSVRLRPGPLYHGVFAVRRGRSAPARLVGALLRLPEEGDEVRVGVRVERGAHGDVWRRRFGDRELRSRQVVRDGELVERYGPLELRCRPQSDGDRLRFVQTGCGLRLGPLYVRIPPRLAPRVEALDWSPDGRRVGVAVEVTAPWAGLLISYEGEVEEQ